MDVKDAIDGEIVLKEILYKYGKSIDEIKNDKILLKELITQLKERSGWSLRKMESILGMEKDKISKVLKTE